MTPTRQPALAMTVSVNGGKRLSMYNTDDCDCSVITVIRFSLLTAFLFMSVD